MYCNNCGKQVSDQARFCPGCGHSFDRPAPPVAPEPSGYAVPAKKKKTGLIVGLSLLAVIVLLLVWFVGKFTFLGPRDLGVRYTEEDFQSAMEKTGVEITFDGMSPDEMEEYRQQVRKEGTKSSIHDYTYEFSDYQRKTFELTPSEATALLNEIAPELWWFDNLQVKVMPDGSMAGSSTADIKRLKEDLYPDVADRIPIPLPDKVNIYSKGDVSIQNNRLSGDPEDFLIGMVPLPERFMTPDAVSTMETYFERLYTVVPNMEIHALESRNGNFYFDGTIPQKVNVSRK
ncbi:MAG: zinc ribbon domain-containing protein [Clostridia bacterium]